MPSDPTVPQPGELLVMLRDPALDRVLIVPGVHEAPHRVGRLLGRLGRRATAHLVDQRELETLDLLLGRALPEGRDFIRARARRGVGAGAA